MIETLGWIGGVLFAICAAPQAYQSYKEGHSKGVNNGLLGLWTAGELITLVYVLLKHGFDGPLVFNYGMNILFLLVIIYYKVKPRSEG